MDLDDEHAATDNHEYELEEAQDQLEWAERDLAIAESKVTELEETILEKDMVTEGLFKKIQRLEDMINTNEAVITQLNNALMKSEIEVISLQNELTSVTSRASYCDMCDSGDIPLDCR